MNIAIGGVYFFLFLALYFEVFLLISFLEKKPGKKTRTLPTKYPSVTMIVPCFNESKTLEATVSSLLSLTYPKEKLDVLIVDDGSKDNTREIAAQFITPGNEKYDSRVRYFYKENGGKYTALNLGIAHSTSELVGCLDADSFVAQDALIESVKKFEEDTEVAGIVPVMKVHNPKNMLEVMQMTEYTFGIFVKKMFDNLSAISVLPGPFSLYRRDVFKKIGPFRHAHNTEDMEIAFRIHKHGLKIVNAHTAFVYTTVPKTVGTLVKQRTRWTQGFLQNSRDYSYMIGNPRFGNFGLFVLPFGLTMFFGALYMTAYLVYQFSTTIIDRALSITTTGIMPRISLPTFDWFYLNLDSITFLIAITLVMTLFSVMVGRRIAEAHFGVGSIISYFMLYGFIAPIWLAKALWGAILARESAWR